MINPIQNSDILLQTRPVLKIQTEISDNAQTPPRGLQTDIEDASGKQTGLPPKNRPNNGNKGAAVEFDVLAGQIKTFLDLSGVNVEFSKDKDTNKMVLKLVDSSTHEVLRQIPEESVLQIARFISKKLGQGSLTDEKI